MTWDEIVALDDRALTQALRAKLGMEIGCPLIDWSAAMALAWAHQLTLLNYQGQWSIANRRNPRDPDGWARTEAEARKAICRLALWAAQQKEA